MLSGEFNFGPYRSTISTASHETKTGKVRVKLSSCLTKRILCLSNHHAMKTYGGVDVQLQAFLISALDGGEWLASRLGRCTHGTHRTVGRVGTREPVWTMWRWEKPSSLSQPRIICPSSCP